MSSPLILVTGGAGYIGSHAVKSLQKLNYDVIVLDNLVYGHRQIVEDVLKVPLVVGQLGDRELLDKLISGKHPSCRGKLVQAVMHFAAYAYVGESVTDPAKYYRNNVGDSLVLIESLKAEGQRRGTPPLPLIFSSTCATYGIPRPELIPINENTPQYPINPYGRSKWMVEQLIADFGAAYGMPSMIFRYFNAAGADPSASLGENHNPETHLIPLILEAVDNNKSELKIFGNDYDTKDGTCIRDYIHVCDIADAHILGLSKLLNKGGQNIYNLGNGKGYSVLEIIRIVENIANCEVNYSFAPRRAGDPPILVASAQKAISELCWKPKYSNIESIIFHAWSWHKKMYINGSSKNSTY